jgi:hypothetical protein
MSKVTKKTAKKVIAKKGRPKSEFPRGYNVEAIDKHLTIDGVSGMYGVYRVEHKALPNPKIFIDKESVVKFINVMEGNKVEAKALSLKGYQHVKGVVSQHKEAMVAPEMEEIAKVLGY